ncbi:MAG: GDSL-type esterase/lipase family protein [Gemmatimonadota bacterium]|nr:GDSL-type esterase/lipase family protein [Gemmatimonadota bacterium]
MPRQRLKTLAVNAGVALISLCVALLAAEGVLRVAGRKPLSPGEPQLITQYDSLLGWSKKPTAKATFMTGEYTVTETTNSHGLRGPETTYEKPRDTYRILMLGDSFAEGYAVDLDSTSARVQERLLNALGDRHYEVINGGTRGYSTDQELLFFDTEGRRYNPDLTILLFYVNDVWYNGQPRYWRGSKPLFTRVNGRLALTNVPVPKPDPNAFAFAVRGATGIAGWVRRTDAWLGVHARLYGLARDAATQSPALSGLAIRFGLAEAPNEWRAWKKSADPELRNAWSLTEAILGRLQQEVVGSGSRLMIFYVPSPPAIYPDDWGVTKRKYAMGDSAWSPEQDAAVLNTICQRAGIACVIPVARFRAEAERLQRAGKRLYFRRDAHWNSDGHRLAGGILADYVRALLAPTAAVSPHVGEL